MARKEIVTRVCDRCSRRDVPSTVTATFAYESTTYQLDLCDDHSTMFDRDMLGWVRLAREVRDHNQRPPVDRTKVPVPTVVARGEIVGEGTPARDHRKEIPRSVSHDWVFTQHALDRMVGRVVGKPEVWRGIAATDKAVSEGKREGTKVYRHGDLKIVVNEEQRVVLTVARLSIDETGDQLMEAING